MPRKSKFSTEEELKIIEQYLNHEKSITQFSKIYSISQTTIRERLITGKGSYSELAAKYGLPS